MSDVLFGRDDDVTAVRAARASGRAGVVLTGPPGIGRTSVLAAIVDEWSDRRIDVLLIRATASSRRLRYAALSPLLAGADLPLDATPLSFGAVHDALARRARRGGLVIAIDDAHLVDDASLRVIADIVGEGDTFVVATVDDTFLGLDPLTESAALVVHPLPALDAHHVALLVSSITGRPADGDVWWQRSHGNPTALRHLLDDPTHDPAASIPGGLDPAARRLLAIVALAEPFPIPVTDTDDPNEHAALDLTKLGVEPATLAELVDRGIVSITTEADRPTLRLRHPGQGTRVRRSLGAIETRAARRVALSSMRGTWATLGPTDRLRVASLAIDAGHELTRDELLDVGALAPAAGDPALALRLARRGAQQLGRFEDLRRLADVAHEQGAVGDLLSAIEQMSERASTPNEHLAVAVARSQHQLWRGADGAAAIAAFDESPARDLPELQAIRARQLATLGRAAEALADGEPFRFDPSPRVRIQAALAVAHSLRRLGRPTRAVAVLDEALANVETVTDHVLSVSGQVLGVVRVLAMLEAGRWADALTQAARAVSYAERYDESAGRAVALVVQAVAQIETGAPGLAIAPVTEAIELMSELHQPGGLRWALSARALAHGLMSDAPAARRDLDALDEIGEHPADLFPSLEPRARAWSLMAAADPEGARSVLRDAIARFRSEGALGPAWSCAHDLLSLDQPADLLDLEVEPAEPLTALRARHAVALQLRNTTDLAALADAYEWLGAYRWAAECSAAHSRAATRSGSREGARRAGERLGHLRARCVALDIPAVAAGRMSALSVREREVALLAARGLPSREIAERLGVSVRTVDNHLAKCFDALGTRSRAELGTLLDG